MSVRAMLLAGLLVFCFRSAAQETRGTIQGRIVDPNGAAVAGAKVTVVSEETNAAVNLVSNETGYYEARFLLPGAYSVSAEAQGFKRIVRKGLVLQMASQLSIDLALELGALTESVSVTAEAPMLDTSAASSGRVLDNMSLTELPLYNGNPTNLVRYAPGVQSSGDNAQGALFANSASSDYRIAGQVGTNAWTIDGAPNDGLDRRVSAIPNTDTIQEMKVETSNFDASFGHSTGVGVSMMTRAGTNAFHGLANWFHRQARWQAADYFQKEFRNKQLNDLLAAGDIAGAEALRNTPIRPSGRTNGYAANLGGPVVLPKLYDGHNRTFFYFSVDGVNPRGTESTFKTIPSMANREGDFSQLLRVDPVRYQIYDPLSVSPDPARPTFFIRQPFAGNRIPQSRIVSPIYKGYLKYYPEPNNENPDPTKDPVQNYRVIAMPSTNDYYGISTRIDHRLNDKHQFFGRVSWTDYQEDRQDWTFMITKGLESTDYIRQSRSGTLDWVYVVNPATVFHAAVAGNEFRQGNRFMASRQFKPSDLGFPKYMDDKAGDRHTMPPLDIAGYESFGTSYPTLTRVSTITGKADASQVRGAHSWKAGVDFREHMRTGGGSGNLSGQFSFDNTYTRRNSDTLTPAGTLGHSWAALMMGFPTAANNAIVDDYAVANPYYALFFQDAWRIGKSLTLNLGLRVEHEFGPAERYNRMMGGFDAAAVLPITATAQSAYAKSPIPEVPASSFSVVGGSLYAGSNGMSRRLIGDAFMWLPRLSVAWQPGRKWVVRAGYGVYYDTFNVLFNGIDQTGYSRTTSTPLALDGGYTWLAGDPPKGISSLTDPFPVRADGTRFDQPVRDSLGLMARAGRGWSFQNFDLKRARVQRVRFGIQRELGSKMVVEAAYAGARTSDIGLGRRLSALPEQYWADGLVRDNALATNLNTQVTNPFYIANFADLKQANPDLYRELSNQSYFINPRIAKNLLMRPFSHMNGLTMNNATDGRARADSIELSFDRRFSQGVSLNVAYTRLWQKAADFYANEFDSTATWRPSNDGRPHRFTASGLWMLPFGRNQFVSGPRWVNAIIGGFQLALTYEYQPGALLDWGNLFYYGDINNIRLENPTIDMWFNTNGFERVASRTPAAFHKRVFPTRIEGVRAHGASWWNGNLTRNITIREGLTFQVRADVVNMTNRYSWGAPDLSPVSTNFGRVTGTGGGAPRSYQLSAKLRF